MCLDNILKDMYVIGDGKDSCDAKGATCKAIAQNYVNTKGDIATAEEFARSLIHKKDMKNADIIIGKTLMPPGEKKRLNELKELSGLTDHLDIEFTPETITFRRFSGIGSGKVYHLKDLAPLNMDSSFEGKIIRHGKDDLDIQEALINPQSCIPTIVEPIKPRKIADLPTIQGKAGESGDGREVVTKVQPNQGAKKKLYPCPTPGCREDFLYKAAMETHLRNGKCNIPVKTMSTSKKALEKFVKKLNEGSFETWRTKSGAIKSSIRKLNKTSIPEQLLRNLDAKEILENYFKRGYGLHKRTRVVRKAHVKTFLKQKFLSGVASGLHASPKDVENAMFKAVSDDGVTPRFHYKDLLEEEQIKGTFSSTYAKQKRGKPIDLGEEEDDAGQLDSPNGYEQESEEYEAIIGQELAKGNLREDVREALLEEEEIESVGRPKGKGKGKGKSTKRSSSLGSIPPVSTNRFIR